MTENVGRTDRIARGIATLALIGGGYTLLGGRHGSLPGLLSMLAGAVLGETVVSRVCAVNYLLDIDTRSDEEALDDLRRAELFTRDHHPRVIHTRSMLASP